jgi:Zn-dependent protease with chaperone function
MDCHDDLYPPSPRNVPADLTTPSDAYRLRVTLLLLSLMVFLWLYLFGLVTSLVLFVYVLACVSFPLSLVPAFFLGLTFFLLVKVLFQRRTQQRQRSLTVEITEEDQPRFFAFLERLCAEINAPLPERVVLGPEVNASAFHELTFVNLFRRPPRSLHLGLGLVNLLTLSEFKAVLAHELGHCIQGSAQLNGYVYRANRILAEMVLGQSRFDVLVRRWCRSDLPVVALLGWVCRGPSWLFQWLLIGAFYAINFLSLSLSRQMEFHADLVAVSVSGSDAVIHGLLRAGFAVGAIEQALSELDTAAQQGLYTQDLFYHQNHAAAYLRRLRNDPHLGEPPALPEDPRLSVQVFQPGDDGVPPLWADHPPNYDREQNAKECYIRAVLDDRSPWLLFDDPHGLRELVTWRFYRVAWRVGKQTELAPAEEVQQFIDEEHAETTYDPRYHGLYDNRFIEPGDLDDQVRAVRVGRCPRPQLAETHANLYGGAFARMMQQYRSRREERDRLQETQQGGGGPGKKGLSFRGRTYNPADAPALMRKVERELDQDREWMASLDGRVFVTFSQMAQDLGGKIAAELLARYQFHVAAQQLLGDLLDHNARLEAVLGQTQGEGALPYSVFQVVRATLLRAHDALARALARAEKLPVPVLRHVRAGRPLAHFLLEKRLLKGLRPYAQRLTGKWIGKFMRQFTEVVAKLRRIHYKSLGGILALQEEIGSRWRSERYLLPEAAAAEPPPPAGEPEADDSSPYYKLL